MVVISKTFSIPQFYDSHAIAPLKDLVFLDIETTGLTPATSSIYLIGAVYHQQMEWHIRQWFSDSLNSEQEILEDFFSFIKNNIDKIINKIPTRAIQIEEIICVFIFFHLIIIIA